MKNHAILTRFEPGGIAADAVLVEELRHPGSDLRFGVNLIVQPPRELQAHIAEIQQYLKQADAEQYYYPAGDLHLTVLEICSSRPQKEAEDIAAQVRAQIAAILQDIAPFELSSAGLACDAKACALTFAAPPALQTARARLIENIKALGIDYRPRYFPTTAHVTWMRYLRPLKQPLPDWVRCLEAAPLRAGLRWEVAALSLSWGATWYGMARRIQTAGPFALA